MSHDECIKECNRRIKWKLSVIAAEAEDFDFVERSEPPDWTRADLAEFARGNWTIDPSYAARRSAKKSLSNDSQTHSKAPGAMLQM